MKTNFDKSFKESLDGFEMPYDAKAWDALSKKLDQKMPTSNPGSSMKWYLGGAAVLGIAVASAVYFYSSNENQSNQKQTATNNNTEITNNTEKSNTSQETVDNSNSAVPTNNSTSGDNTEANVNEVNSSNTNSTNTNSANSTTNNRTNDLNRNNSNDNTVGQEDRQNDRPNPIIRAVVLPEVNNICEGENILIENKNDVSIYLISPTNEKTEIAAKSKIKQLANEEGQYLIAQMKGDQIIKSNDFSVLPSPRVDMSYDNINIYDKGLPTINMKSSSIGTAFEWSFEGKNKKAFGKEVNVHYFNKGMYTTTLTVTGTNGCSASEQMKVEVADDYNLMAVSAFNPNSHIEKNRTFMPHALKERNTPFYMIIIDASTGGIVYETNDSNNPWTGIDKRNGQMVEPNKTYIWKVTLTQPIEGEKAEYKGTVVLQ